MPFPDEIDAIQDMGPTLAEPRHTIIHGQLKGAVNRVQSYAKTWIEWMNQPGWVTTTRLANGAVTNDKLSGFHAQKITSGIVNPIFGGTGRNELPNGRILFGRGPQFAMDSIHPNDLREYMGVMVFHNVIFSWNGTSRTSVLMTVLGNDGRMMSHGSTGEVLWVGGHFQHMEGIGPAWIQCNPRGGGNYHLYGQRLDPAPYAGQHPADLLVIFRVNTIPGGS